MAPTGLDIKRNIVRLAELRGLKQKDFIDAGIGATTVKSIFKRGFGQTPDLETVNKFAEVMGVETYIFFIRNLRRKIYGPEDMKEVIADVAMPSHRRRRSLQPLAQLSLALFFLKWYNEKTQTYQKCHIHFGKYIIENVHIIMI